MKEITRIHIAKIAYDIELDAKKDLEKYIKALERYADDAELLDDIEIRITELLAERGVQAGGVIGSSDVAGIRKQLGEPSDFAPEGSEAVAEIEEIDDSVRKLYRDQESAVLGGVLAGIAHFLKVEAIYIRLIFVIILIGSVGTASLVYLILWLIVPPARTAAEKLQMRGRSVTLESIKKLGDQSDTRSQTAEITRRLIRYFVGVALVVGGIGSLTAAAAVTAKVLLSPLADSPFAVVGEITGSNWWVALALALFILAGLLLATLFFMLASALFRGRWSRRMGTGVIAVITAGILAFTGGVGMIWYGGWRENVKLYDSRQVMGADLPAGFQDVTRLKIESDEGFYGQVNVEYIVSDKLRYEFESLPGVKPKVLIDEDGVLATISFKSSNERLWGGYIVPSLRVYGPKLDSVDSQGVDFSYSNNEKQDKLEVVGGNGSVVINGVYGQVEARGSDIGTIALSGAVVENLSVQLEHGRVVAGVVRSLTVSQPDACASRGGEMHSVAIVQSVSGGKITYNGEERDSETIEHDCGLVFIGSESDYENWSSLKSANDIQ